MLYNFLFIVKSFKIIVLLDRVNKLLLIKKFTFAKDNLGILGI